MNKCQNCQKEIVPDLRHPYQRFCSQYCRGRFYVGKNRKRVRDYQNKYHTEWRKKNKKQWNAIVKKTQQGYKKKLFALFGNKCAKCGFTDERALQLDHINGSGSKERKLFKNSTYLYFYYSKHPEEARKKLQLLCANCNWIKRVENKEFAFHS